MIFFSHCPGGCIPGDGFSPVSPRTAPPPGGGGFEEERTGTRLRGGETPSPVPSPHGDSHHGPVHGENLGENRVQANS